MVLFGLLDILCMNSNVLISLAFIDCPQVGNNVFSCKVLSTEFLSSLVQSNEVHIDRVRLTQLLLRAFYLNLVFLFIARLEKGGISQGSIVAFLKLLVLVDLDLESEQFVHVLAELLPLDVAIAVGVARFDQFLPEVFAHVRLHHYVEIGLSEPLFDFIRADLPVAVPVEDIECDPEILLVEQLGLVGSTRHEFGEADLAVAVGVKGIEQRTPIHILPPHV